ncbi:MAG: DNA-directed RNA polymerase subunit L [Nanoarchaeota archaeon]|nr:DNA-directed RNA polymerase subunit L [Nanoarchaeota archaeon]
MEINVLEYKKNRLKFELIGRTHTLANVLSKELWNDKDIAVAGYTLAHPMTGNATLVVETNKGDPKKALRDAITRLKKKNKEFLTLIKSLK